MAIDLAALTARVKARVVVEAAAKVAKVAAGKDPKKAAEALVLANLADWVSVAVVLSHNDWRCACGASGIAPGGLFLAQEHARMANCTRLVAVTPEDDISHLPKRQMTAIRHTEVCFFCATAQGYVKPHAFQVATPTTADFPPTIHLAAQSGRVHLDGSETTPV